MTKKELSPLSPAETEIMRLVWQLSGPTVQQVCEALPQKRTITYATVQTMLRRLEKKGYLKHESRGKHMCLSRLCEGPGAWLSGAVVSG